MLEFLWFSLESTAACSFVSRRWRECRSNRPINLIRVYKIIESNSTNVFMVFVTADGILKDFG